MATAGEFCTTGHELQNTEAGKNQPQIHPQIQTQILNLRPATDPNDSNSSFFEFLDPKIGGGVPNTNPTPAGGSLGGGGRVDLCHICL